MAAGSERLPFRIATTRAWVHHVTDRVATVRIFLRKAGARMKGRPYVDGADYSSASKPSIFERSGQHPIRETSVRWCRAHPVEAAALPSWNLEVLRKVLDGVV